MRCSVVLLFLLVISASPASGQDYDADGALAGVDSMSALVVLSWDEEIRGYAEATVRSRLQTVLQLELLNQLIPVSFGARNTLLFWATILAGADLLPGADPADGLVAYSYRLYLLEQTIPSQVVTPQLLQRMLAPSGTGPTDVVGLHLYEALVNSGFVTITWQGAGGVAAVGRDDLEDSLEGAVRDAAQHLANVWLAAHPR